MENAEAYMYDGECLAKAEEMGKPGLVTIRQRQVRPRLQHEVFWTKQWLGSNPFIHPKIRDPDDKSAGCC